MRRKYQADETVSANFEQFADNGGNLFTNPEAFTSSVWLTGSEVLEPYCDLSDFSSSTPEHRVNNVASTDCAFSQFSYFVHVVNKY